MIVNSRIEKIQLKQIKVLFSDVDGTLTDGFTVYSEKGEKYKRFNHKDGRGVFLLRNKSIKFGIITGENSNIVLRRAEKLNADFCYIGVENKLSLIKKVCIQYNYKLSEIAFIGDDTNDLEIMKNVGVSFAVKDSVIEIRKIANYICNNNGGHGAFREAADFLIQVRQ